MRIVIVSDIHANYDAWNAFSEEYDELWVLGDLVNYGPQPREVLEDVRKRAKLVVQGNHDYAVGHEDDSQWHPRFRAMAEITRRFTSSQLSHEQHQYLRQLPVTLHAERDGTRFQLVHALPSNPHYGRLAPDAEEWAKEIEGLAADVLLVGHSHVPFIRRVQDKTIVNPGSIGQPRSGDAQASYAIWDDGFLELRSLVYPVETTVAKLARLNFPRGVEDALTTILRSGQI